MPRQNKNHERDNLKQAISRAQDLVRRYVPENRSLSDELIRERREEAEQENKP